MPSQDERKDRHTAALTVMLLSFMVLPGCEHGTDEPSTGIACANEVVWGGNIEVSMTEVSVRACVESDCKEMTAPVLPGTCRAPPTYDAPWLYSMCAIGPALSADGGSDGDAGTTHVAVVMHADPERAEEMTDGDMAELTIWDQDGNEVLHSVMDIDYNMWLLRDGGNVLCRHAELPLQADP